MWDVGELTHLDWYFGSQSYEVGNVFLVPPKGHPIYTLTNIKKEPYIHSPKTVI